MINTQNNFIHVLENLLEIAKNSEIDTFDTENIKKYVEEAQLIIPVVGDFNAGKSSLLNKFIGKYVLEVEDLAETSIANELYYSSNEYITAVDNTGKEHIIETFDKKDSIKYHYIKRYINSENLKKIEPIILVDMPGFNSPYEHHNKSIMTYLDRGVYFIILSDINKGTISKTLNRQIKNMKEMKRDFSFFITKSEYKNEEEKNQIREEIKLRLKEIGIEKEIYNISKNNIDLFDSVITKLNIEDIFYNTYIDALKEAVYKLESSIKIKISALQKDKNSNENIIYELEESIRKIKSKKDHMILEEENKSYDAQANNIVNEIGKELYDHTDLLVYEVINNGSDLKEEILNIIQPILISKTNKTLENINLNIKSVFSKEIKDLDSVLKEYNIPDFVDKIGDTFKEYKNKLKENKKDVKIEKKTNNKTNNENNTNKAKDILSLLAIATDFIDPILEILIVFLPEILNFVFVSIQKYQQKEELKTVIINQISRIQKELKIKITEILKDNSREIIKNISESYDIELEKKKKEIEEIQEKLSKENNIDELIKNLNNNLYKIKELSSSLI